MQGDFRDLTFSLIQMVISISGPMNKDGGGPIRLAISDNSGQVTIGGTDVFCALQLKDHSDRNTIFIGAHQKLKQTLR